MSGEALSAANHGELVARKATMVGAILTAKKEMVLWENSIIIMAIEKHPMLSA